MKRGRINLAGQLPNTMYPPSIYAERNYGGLARAKLADLLPALSAAWLKRTHVIVGCGSADDLNPIPDGSIDYIYMDPPFGSNIFYGDCSFLWESWLGRLMDLRFEAVINPSNRGSPHQKGRAEYTALMCGAFASAFRVLKPGRACTVVFNNSDGDVFEVIKEAIRSSGFVIQNMAFLDKVQKTFKGFKGETGAEDVVGHDVVFNLRKPQAVEGRLASADDRADVARVLAQSVADHLRTLPERMAVDPEVYTEEHRTTPFLNTMLMNRLIPLGVNVSQLNLPFIEQVCSRYFRNIDGRWYLRNEAVGSGNGEALLIEHEVEISDELSAIAWLRQQLAGQPMMIGEISGSAEEVVLMIHSFNRDPTGSAPATAATGPACSPLGHG